MYKYISILFFCSYILACQNDIVRFDKETNVEKLVSVETVKKWMDQQFDFTLIEVSKLDHYQKGHLPNALHLWRPDYENKTDYPYSGMQASKVQMEQLLSKLGLQTDSKIVLYDSKGSVDAIRLWWILTNYGHQDIMILDGGKVAWKLANHTLEKQIPEMQPTSYTFAKNAQKVNYISLEDVQAATLSEEQVVILDTREPEEYFGSPYLNKGKLHRYKSGAYINGCIPNAVHLNWSDAVDLKGNHCIKALADLKYNFEQMGVTPDKKIIAYCQSGVRSAHTTFILTHILGYPNVQNYDGSWIEWSYHHVNGNKVAIQQHRSHEEVETSYALLSKKLSKQ